METESFETGILATAHELKQQKARSLHTAGAHLQTVKERGHEVVVGLLGSSLIERMKTTGQCDNLETWPSEIMTPDSDIQAMNDARDDTDADPVARIQGVANFGCGGDKINNILYRVMGDSHVGLNGLLQELNPSTEDSLTTRRNLKLWVIQAGTNNLHRKHGLKDDDVRSMGVLLRTLHYLSRPGTKFLLTGLFYRTDIPNELVDRANEAYKSLVATLDQEVPEAPQQADTTNQSQSSTALGYGNGTFSFLPAPQVDDSSPWLIDHVHLHQNAYQKWMKTLLPKVHDMLRAPTPGGAHGQEASL